MTDTIRTRLWDETPDPRSPFAGRTVRLAGYDYYGDLLGQAGWADMVWLLFAGDPPSPAQRRLFEHLAVALANPGPRDPSVHAAMCGGIGGSHPAASLMAALAVSAGDHGGSEELARALRAWCDVADSGHDLADALAANANMDGTWPGFSPHLSHTPETVLTCLATLCQSPLAERLAQLHTEAPALTQRCGRGMNLTGVAAAAFADLGVSSAPAEALYLLMRLPGALAHALEQSERGYRNFPFFTLSEHPQAVTHD